MQASVLLLDVLAQDNLGELYCHQHDNIRCCWNKHLARSDGAPSSHADNSQFTNLVE